MGCTSKPWVRDAFMWSRARLITTEGDVDGIMERPSGSSEQDQRAREKWYVMVSVSSQLNIHVNMQV